MTTELEEQFFKVFGIEPKWKDKRVKNFKTHYTEKQAQYLRETTKNRNIQLCYPEITDRKLLKMICILNSTNGINCTAYESKNISDLKKEILNECMNISDDIELKAKIQQLFEEEE